MQDLKIKKIKHCLSGGLRFEKAKFQLVVKILATCGIISGMLDHFFFIFAIMWLTEKYHMGELYSAESQGYCSGSVVVFVHCVRSWLCISGNALKGQKKSQAASFSPTGKSMISLLHLLFE